MAKVAMRLLICFLLVVCLPAFADADETAFKEQLASYVQRHSWAFPPELTKRSLELRIDLSIDRDGKLLGADVTKASLAVAEADAALIAFRRMQPFPRIPDELQAPYKFSAIFVFMPPSEIGRVKFSWIGDEPSLGPEEVYRKSLLSRIDGSAISLSAEMKTLSGRLDFEVALTIERDGQFSRTDMIKGSGSAGIDSAMLRWLKPRDPFPPLPISIAAPAHLRAKLKIVRPSDPEYQTRWEADDARMKARVNGVCRGC